LERKSKSGKKKRDKADRESLAVGKTSKKVRKREVQEKKTHYSPIFRRGGATRLTTLKSLLGGGKVK